MSEESKASAPNLSTVYEENIHYVWRLLARFGVPKRDLEDVAHDAFVVIHRKLADFDPSRPIRPWLAGIAFRVAVAYNRQKRRGEVPSELPDVMSPTDVEERIVKRNLRAAALELLERVPIERRAVFILHELEGLSAPEIADALSTPLNTVYSRLRLARSDLRRHAKTAGGRL